MPKYRETIEEITSKRTSDKQQTKNYFSSLLEEIIDKCKIWKLDIETIDVGKGDAKLLLFRSYDFGTAKYEIDKAILIDAGDGWYGAILNKLLTFKLSKKRTNNGKLDAVVLTHYERDHTAGLPLLAEHLNEHTLFITPKKGDDYLRDILGIRNIPKANQFCGEKILNQSIWTLFGIPKPMGAPDLTFIAVEGKMKHPTDGTLIALKPILNANEGSIVSLIDHDGLHYLTCGGVGYTILAGVAKWLKHCIKPNRNCSKIHVLQLPLHGDGTDYKRKDLQIFEEFGTEIVYISNGFLQKQSDGTRWSVFKDVTEKLKYIYCTNNPIIETKKLKGMSNVIIAGDYNKVTVASNMTGNDQKKVFGHIKTIFANKLQAMDRRKTTYYTVTYDEHMNISGVWLNVDCIKLKSPERIETIKNVFITAKLQNAKGLTTVRNSSAKKGYSIISPKKREEEKEDEKEEDLLYHIEDIKDFFSQKTIDGKIVSKPKLKFSTVMRLIKNSDTKGIKEGLPTLYLNQIDSDVKLIGIRDQNGMLLFQKNIKFGSEKIDGNLKKFHEVFISRRMPESYYWK